LSTEELIILKRFRNSKQNLSDSITRKIDAVVKNKNKIDVLIPQYRIIAK